MTKIAITGAAGRMGRRVAALAIESERFDIVSVMESAGHEAIGRDLGELAGVGTFGVNVSETMDGRPDVLIDFSVPKGTMHWLEVCSQHDVPMVIGTTGLTDSQLAEIADAAGRIAIVRSANMSVGVNLLLRLVGQVARALGDDYDVEISETHHRFKKDAPSGTALELGRAICAAKGAEPDERIVYGREGKSLRSGGEIGIHALRVGDTVGEHTVYFGDLGETVSLGHVAHTRDTFARGALRAARWLAARPAGLYSMQDVLFAEAP